MLESRPKYRVIQDLIRARIEDSGLISGGKLPAEHDMAREFGVAYMTVRGAVNALIAEGLLRHTGRRICLCRRTSPWSASATSISRSTCSLR